MKGAMWLSPAFSAVVHVANGARNVDDVVATI